MDKKNVQNRSAKILLTDEIFSYDVEKLWSQSKPNIFFCDDKFFLFFCRKWLKKSPMEIYGNIWKSN